MAGSKQGVSRFFRGSLGRLMRASAVLGALCLAPFARPQLAQAEDVQVAVAGNFAPTLQKLAPVFSARSGHNVVQSSGASGQLFAQISNGAPFQVFLSADSERPKELEAKGLAVQGTRFVYAEGRLVLWSPTPGRVDAKGDVLSKPQLGTVALADPRAAPYGAAAERVLRAKKQWDKLSKAKKLALGTSITQAHQFVATGNADLGFVALSQVRGEDGSIPGSSWLVPKELAGPITQEAVLLSPGQGSAAAGAFLAFLRSDSEARAIIAAAGYELPPAPAPAATRPGLVLKGGLHGPRSNAQSVQGPSAPAAAQPPAPAPQP